MSINDNNFSLIDELKGDKTPLGNSMSYLTIGLPFILRLGKTNNSKNTKARIRKKE